MTTPAGDADDASARLRRDGYCVVRGALPATVLDDAVEAFARHVLSYSGCLLRQSHRREPNRIGPSGGLVNSLMDIHREPAPEIRPFGRAIAAVIGHPAVVEMLERRFGCPVRAVSVLCLDESKNGPHQDHAYEDSVPPSQLVGLLVPLWPSVGPAHNRFFVVPGSADRVVPYSDESLRSNEYIRDVYSAVAKRHGGRLVPLDLARGDIVLFDALMIHGTILGESGRLPRIAAHYLPEDAVYRGYGLERPVAVRDHGLALTGARE